MGGAWNSRKRKMFENSFYDFLGHTFINSKDLGGHTCLGDHVYDSQKVFLTKVLDGLQDDIHSFYVLKSRQLGLSTFSRALTIFYLGLHDGLQGATVFDTDQNKNKARREIEAMIDNLPKMVKFPRIKTRNRDGLTLENQAELQFFSAGIKASKSSGTLGRSSGLSMAHLSELCSYDSEAGIEAFRNSLSDTNPDRLYIYESTPRGYNLWHDIWTEAKADENHAVCMFLGWYLKASQRIERTDPDWLKYGEPPVSEIEAEKIQMVHDLYQWDVTPEQLAWHRRRMDPAAKQEGDAPAEFVGTGLRLQEQAWGEIDAWQQSGAAFFDSTNLTEITNKYASKKFKTYSYSYGTEFIYCKVWPARNARSVELKVWEEPDEDGIYICGTDVAFGYNENNDRSSIQVVRCYADGLDQVAEYAWPLVNSRQLAWVLASLLAWYAGEKAEVYNIFEINGPGEAMKQELDRLKQDMSSGYLVKETQERGLQRIWTNVRDYVYKRTDSMTSGRAWQWQTNAQTKVAIMERLRDFVSNDMIRLRSMDLIEEMKSITREAGTVAAPGAKKDDRVMALAMAVRYWEDRVRRGLSAQKRTRENEANRKRMTIKDQAALFSAYHLEQMFKVRRIQRVREDQRMRRLAWRGR